MTCNRNDRNTRIIDDEQVRCGTDKEDFEKSLRTIYIALQEKGYDPVQQLAHYLLTGEPAYITAHRNARSLTSHLERDEIIEEFVRFYVENHPAMRSCD